MKRRSSWLRVVQACLVLPVLVGTPAAATAASVYTVDLVLEPPGDSNTIELAITGTLLGSTKSDSDTADVSGNILASLGVVIDAETMEAEAVETLEFTGGRITIGDMSYSLSWFLVGGIDVDSSGIGGTFDTPVPPGPVSGGSFGAADHLFILNEGAFEAEGSGLIADFLPENPYVVHLADEPIEVTTEATGYIDVSPPTIEGDLAFYDVTLTLPLEIDQIVFEEPDTAEVRAVGTATLEARGRFSQSLPDFGAVAPPVFTELEEANPGDTSFTRGTGDVELEWALEAATVSGAAEVDASFTDPADASNHQQFHVNNAEVVFLTEPIDVRSEKDPRISIDLRTWDTSTGFEADDYLEIAILVGYDGIQFEEKVSWLRLAGGELTALNGGRDGPFTTYETPAGLLPQGTQSIRIEITVDNNSANEHVLWDNIQVGVEQGPEFRRGDANADGKCDVSDAVSILGHLFLGSPANLACEKAADADDKGSLDLTDAVYVLGHLFLGGPEPPLPFATCGPDPTEDDLECAEFSPCGT